MIDHQSGTAINSTAQLRPAEGFRDPTRLTRWLKILLWALIGLGTIAVISDLLELKLLNDIQAGVPLRPGEATENDARQRLIGIVYFIAYIVMAIVFLMWIYRANYNARQLGAAGMTFTPGWAVGSFFIPVVNLWEPYRAMKEIWKASANPVHWQDQQRGAILPLWWLLYLMMNFVSIIQAPMMREAIAAKSLPNLIAASTTKIGRDALFFAFSGVALRLVIQIFRMQMANRFAGVFR
jgi:hypothetical protein